MFADILYAIVPKWLQLLYFYGPDMVRQVAQDTSFAASMEEATSTYRTQVYRLLPHRFRTIQFKIRQERPQTASLTELLDQTTHITAWRLDEENAEECVFTYVGATPFPWEIDTDLRVGLSSDLLGRIEKFMIDVHRARRLESTYMKHWSA